MKRIIVLAALAALAACNQQAAEPEAPAAPMSLRAQVRSMAPEMQPVFAYQQLAAHLQAEGQACTGPRGAESRGTVPENVAPDSIYAPFAGADVYTVQCGEQLTTVRSDPRQRWLVAFAEGAEEAQYANCADPRGIDLCVSRQIPTLDAAATP
jgi:hypothetical protein